MTNKQSIFSGKILLFGEYTVILGARALSVPYTRVGGSLKKKGLLANGKDDEPERSNKMLKGFLDYLTKSDQRKNEEIFRLTGLRRDIAEGMYFSSDIPQGYGLGSSGALVAALYSEYARKPLPARSDLEEHQLLRLKKLFAYMESHFHGTSSGLDPLNSYLGCPLLIEKKDLIRPVSLPGCDEKSSETVFMINTGMPRETGPLVRLFLEKMEDHSYRHSVQEELIPLAEQCIGEFIAGHAPAFHARLEKLSGLQLRLFREMIPERFRADWEEGIKTGTYKLKLMGAGGGGYILGFTGDYTATASILQRRSREIIPVCRWA